MALFVEAEPAWACVQAIRAEPALSFRPRARRQLRELARRHGFELGEGLGLPRHTLTLLGNNLLILGFTRAYNPAALARCPLLQGRQELWLSRRVLLAVYGSAAADAPAVPHGTA